MEAGGSENHSWLHHEFEDSLEYKILCHVGWVGVRVRACVRVCARVRVCVFVPACVHACVRACIAFCISTALKKQILGQRDD